MADIKTRDVVKGTIKKIDKAAIAADRMRSAYVQTKEKAEHATHPDEHNAEEYASDRVEGGVDRITHEVAHQFDKQGRKGLEETKRNVSKAKDGVQRFREKRVAESMKRQTVRTSGNKTIKAVEQTEKTIKQSAGSAGKKTIKTAGKGTAKAAQRSVKTTKTAIKTTQQAAKTAQKTAQATVKASQKAAQAAKAVETTRRAGIDNISIDLMFGFPNETLNDWQNDLDAALKLRPNHISAYSLMYEEGTPLYLMLQNDKVQQTDDDTCLAMYTMLMDTLSANGYEHYEISNFCLPGYRAIHNSSYWNDTPYLGFGAAAHSYNLLTRSWNVADIKEYVSAIGSGNLASESERIDDDTHYDDIITTAMRTCEGVDLMRLKPEYRNYALRSAKNDIDGGLLELADDHLRLTRKGLFVSDMVMSNLMKV